MTDDKTPTPTTVPTPPEPTPATSAPTGVETAPNTNGAFPAELHGWNWGAFFLNWIWGIGHRVWVALVVIPLVFVPFFGLIGIIAMMIVLGVKGNEWAWQNRQFASVDEFRKVQKIWAIWGLVIFVVLVVFLLTAGAALVGLLMGSMGTGGVDVQY